MFFTRLAILVAVLLVAFSVLHLALAYLMIFGTTMTAENQAAVVSYLGAENGGQVVSLGMLYLALGIGLGTLAEISRHLARND